MAVKLFHLDQATAGEFALWQEALKLRNDVLKEQLGWDLFARAGCEVDEYDNPYALNVCHVDHTGALKGYVRLNPMTKPFLLMDHFAHAFQCDFGIRARGYESTRAVLSPALKGPARTVALAEMMSSAMVLLARAEQMERIYFVTEAALVPHLMGPFELETHFFERRGGADDTLVAGFYYASEAKGLEIAARFGVDIDPFLTGAETWAV